MRKIIAISLAVILLASNLGFTMATHFCGGEAVMSRISLGHANVSCGMADMDDDCENEHNRSSGIDAEPCCANQYQTLQVDDDFNKSLQFNLTVDFVDVFVSSIFNNIFSAETTPKLRENYHPPPLERDIPVHIQSFLL